MLHPSKKAGVALRRPFHFRRRRAQTSRMADVFTPKQRSAVMARVKSADTKPELQVRKLLFAMNYRFRLQGRDLPGRPDIVFRTRRKAVFVHGCFWHGCEKPGCRGARRPKSNTSYWVEKLARNKARDRKNVDQLASLGWTTHTIWECDLADPEAVARDLSMFLGPPRLT